ncbi:MAG: AarF/ABC1/UbiB kinase family protein [Desulfuromonadaceae bacterium]|nr:AarF/ABC1/UbiB kinase family protein [Desulfuromonadaceae bacterium]
MLPLLKINRNLRSLKRYREILGILVTYGFGQIIEQLNIDYYIERGRRLILRDPQQRDLERLPAEVRLRMALERLGPTFIKFGQLLSTRADILPASYILELKTLQDQVLPVAWDRIKTHIETELGLPCHELFQQIDPKPVASASMAQVHRAQLHNQDWIALKVRRPGIEKIIATDLDILTGLATLIEYNEELSQIVSATELVKEFRRTIYRELDFTKEAHTMERFRANFSHDEAVYVPSVYWDYTTDALLTMELVNGTKISQISQLREHGHDLKELAHRGAQCFMAQVIHHGLFHGDPHPGNIFILDDGRICFLDLGMVGHIDEELKQQLVNLLLAIFNKDTDLLISVLVTRLPRAQEFDKPALKRDLLEFIEDYHQRPLKQIDAFKLVTEFINIMSRHHIRFPSDLMLLTKALVTIEGIGRDLDPDFNLMAELQPNIVALIKKRLSTENLSKQTLQTLRFYLDAAKTLPHDLKELLFHINNNHVKINLEHRGLQQLIRDLDKSSNRLSFSFLIGSLIVGSSLIVQSGSGPHLFGLPALSLLGYTIAGLLGLWLAIGILGSGRL